MKLDTTYKYIYKCPVTDVQVSDREKEFEDVCSQCGDETNSLYGTHAVRVVGRWNRPSLIELNFKGKEPEFITKASEDKLLEALKQ